MNGAPASWEGGRLLGDFLGGLVGEDGVLVGILGVPVGVGGVLVGFFVVAGLVVTTPMSKSAHRGPWCSAAAWWALAASS
jgi:hypothetical protein